jgi:AraC-like DNA-binding protein
MGKRTSANEVVRAEAFEFWQEIICRTLLEGECRDVAVGAFHGEVSRRSVSGVSFARVSSVGQRYVRTRRHIADSRVDCLVVMLQLSGSGVVSQSGRELQLEPGDLTCTDSNQASALSFADTFEQLVIQVPRESITRALGPLDPLVLLPCPRSSVVGSVLSPLLRRAPAILEEVRPHTAERLSDTCVSAIITMLGELSSDAHESARWARTTLRCRAEAVIDAHARDHALTPEAVAGRLRISTRYLQDLFHEDQTTPSERIWWRRLEESRRELGDPQLDALGIGEIALRSGFFDFAHFSRRFRVAYGMSPREYRRQHGRP